MRQSAIDPALASPIGQRADETGANFPFSGQLKGDSWYVFDATTGGWGNTPYQTCAAAENAAAECKRNQQARIAADVLKQAEASETKRATRKAKPAEPVASDTVGQTTEA
ncbi:hypothetical protein CJ97_gp12 [Ralstonia phage RSB2]|uniref:Uncharacterized protein ORF12 n=1 Tax=Ralstonia phage RSB2 TaxID=913183 RepID=E5RUZ2_9CAUD|nr:hypothetical protein CJ97_gp12 [Ralstonia phage RSB2]BAJ51800.1 hypothetical protein [Ralstonia phage RSB2]